MNGPERRRGHADEAGFWRSSGARLARVVALAVALGWGCSDPLVDGNYRGEPLLEIRGKVQLLANDSAKTPRTGWGWHDPRDDQAATIDLPPGDLRLALVWSIDGLDKKPRDAVTGVEQQTVTTTSFPSRYAIALYAPPPDDLLADAKGGEGRYALGLLVVYADANGDGEWGTDEDELIGGAPGRGVIYTPTGVTSSVLGTHDRGYHRVKVREDTNACSKFGALRLESDPAAELDLVVGETLPSGVLMDVNCDGKWGNPYMCPPKSQLKLQCPPQGGKGWPCAYCPR